MSVQHGIETIVDILCESAFTDEEIGLIEDYFAGGSDDILKKLHYREEMNLSTNVDDDLKEELRWLVQSGKEEDVKKVCRLIFSVWELNADCCFPEEIFSEKYSMPISEPAVRTALFTYHVSVCESRMSKPYMNRLMNYAQNDPEVIKKALGYRGKSTPESIILLAVYFLLKYPQIGPEDSEGGLETLLERQGISGEESAQDIAMMGQYEDLLLEIFSEIYYYKRPKKDTDKIIKAIREDRVDEGILKMAVAKVPKDCVKIYLDSYTKFHVGGMAFINFALSRRLKNIVSVCLAANARDMFYTIGSVDMRGDFEIRGGSFDRVFGVDSYWLIRCAAVLRMENILKEQLARNCEIYFKCMDDLNFRIYHYMAEVIRQTDENLHKEREHEELARQQGLLTDAMTDGVHRDFGKLMKKYLMGKAKLESLYPSCEGVWQKRELGVWHWEMLEDYRKFYGHDAFCRKCEAALMVCGGFDNFNYLLEDGVLKKERLRELFGAMDEMGLAPRFQLKGYTDMYYSLHSREKWLPVFLGAGEEIFGAYARERREEMQEAFRNAGAPGRMIELRILSREPGDLSAEGEKEPSGGQESAAGQRLVVGQIVRFCQDPSKEVKDALVEILCGAKDQEEEVISLLFSQAEEERKIAVRVLARWEEDKYALILKEGFIRERNAELKAFLAAVLPVDKLVRLEGSRIFEEIIKELHKGNKKRSLAWAYETPFSKVHKKNGEEADEEYLQAVLLAYAVMAPKSDVVPYGVSSVAEALAGELDEKEYAVYIGELLDKWIEAGADTRKRWVLFAAANHGDAEMSGRLLEAVQEWSGKRAPIAMEAVRALCLSLRPGALLMVEELSRKDKVRKIREAAKKALDSTASWLGTTRGGLMDRTVPDLGFCGKRERVFDYGARRFSVDIAADFEVRVFDESGKKLKNLPSPGKRDDETRANAAREEFKNLKKQIKTVVKSQKQRLEEALSNGQCWEIDAWKELFMGNPVMFRLGMGLIWGFYEDGKLKKTFRYQEDGALDVEKISAGDIRIALVHPVELSQDSLREWKEQLENDGVVQPFEQLDRAVFKRTGEEAGQKDLERFKGMIIKESTFKKRLRAFGWSSYLGEEIFYKENQELSLGVEIGVEERFEYYETGIMGNLTVYEVKFYDLSDKEDYEMDYYYLGDVPERYFSEIVLELTNVTADCERRDLE